MTSNIGSPYLMDGVDASGQIGEEARDRVMGEMRQHFRPEFLNRVDDVVLFKPLTLDELKHIVELQIGDIRKRLAERRITLDITDEAKQLVAEGGYDPVYGARPLKRYLQHELETRIGRAILKGDITDGSNITVTVEDDALSVQTTKA